jgi:hypothetical protein
VRGSRDLNRGKATEETGEEPVGERGREGPPSAHFPQDKEIDFTPAIW